MSDFIKFTGKDGADYVRRTDVRSAGVWNDGRAVVWLTDGREVKTTDPLPVIEAALGYAEHPAVAELARYKIHLDDIRCDLADAGIAIPADDDPELTPRRMVKALIAEATRLRADLATVRDAERNTMARLRQICTERDGLIRKLDAAQEGAPTVATPKPGDAKHDPKPEPTPTFTPAKVGDRWGDLTDEQIGAFGDTAAMSVQDKEGTWAPPRDVATVEDIEAALQPPKKSFAARVGEHFATTAVRMDSGRGTLTLSHGLRRLHLVCDGDGAWTFLRTAPTGSWTPKGYAPTVEDVIALWVRT